MGIRRRQEAYKQRAGNMVGPHSGINPQIGTKRNGGKPLPGKGTPRVQSDPLPKLRRIIEYVLTCKDGQRLVGVLKGSGQVVQTAPGWEKYIGMRLEYLIEKEGCTETHRLSGEREESR